MYVKAAFNRLISACSGILYNLTDDLYYAIDVPPTHIESNLDQVRTAGECFFPRMITKYIMCNKQGLVWSMMDQWQLLYTWMWLARLPHYHHAHLTLPLSAGMEAGITPSNITSTNVIVEHYTRENKSDYAVFFLRGGGGGCHEGQFDNLREKKSGSVAKGLYYIGLFK